MRPKIKNRINKYMKKTLKIEGKNKLLEVLHVTLEWNF